MIDLTAHWWGAGVVPLITLAVALVVATIGGRVVRRGGARGAGSAAVSLQQSAEAEGVAKTFQVTFLTLTTLMVLCFAARSERSSALLLNAYCLMAGVLLSCGLWLGLARGKGLLRNTFLLAAAFGVVLSLFVGVIVLVEIEYGVHEFVQSH